MEVAMPVSPMEAPPIASCRAFLPAQTLVPNPFFGVITDQTSALSREQIARRSLMLPYPQYTSIQQSNSGQFRTFQANAMARAQQAGQHPLFMGDSILWNGMVIP